MTSIDVFYQGEGIREIAHFEADAEHRFAAIKIAIIEKHGLAKETLIYLEDRDEPVDENCLVRDHASHSGIKAHLHRCRHVEVAVTFNGETVHHRFGPGTTVARVKTWATESTSILSDATLIDVKKTRAMAAWAERRGFTTAIHERLFDASFRRQDDEPAVALCGLDNGAGRQALDQVGFDFVVEAGLGRGHRDFRAIRLHTLPASRPASQIWRGAQADDQVEDRPAYKGMLTSGALDRCGVTLLAGKAVGAPFVGAVAATLAVSEVLRLLQGGAVHELIDLDLKAPEYRSAVPTAQDFSTLNPGYVPV